MADAPEIDGIPADATDAEMAAALDELKSIESFLRHTMQDAGVPARMIDASMPEALRKFDAYLAEGNSRAAAELQFKRDIDQASSIGNRRSSEEIQADAERTMRLVMLKMKLPRDEIELQLPAATRFFMVHLAQGHSPAHVLKLFRARREKAKKLCREQSPEHKAELEGCLRTCIELQEDYDSYDQNPDLSGALHVLKILDKLDDAAAPARQQTAPESKTSGWRHASVEDYGKAMREALEELAESDRAKVEGSRRLYEAAMWKTLPLMNESVPKHMTFADLERHLRMHRRQGARVRGGLDVAGVVGGI